MKNEGKKVLLVAADTFRAGAIEQINEWAAKVDVDVINGNSSDPSSVVFDGIKKATEENYDIVLIDTAGRLHNKINLMNELSKIKRVMQKVIPDAPHEVLLVLDNFDLYLQYLIEYFEPFPFASYIVLLLIGY